MNKASLKALGIEDDELIGKIIIEHGRDIEGLKAELKAKELAEAEALKQIEEANGQIEKFKSLDIEGIRTAADEWKAKAEAAQKEAAEQVAKMRFDHAVETNLAGANVRNPKALRALLDFDKMKLGEDGQLSGLSEQLETIRQSDDYLFSDSKEPPKVIAGSKSKQITNADPLVAAVRSAAGLAE